jgi:hypothetical protein
MASQEVIDQDIRQSDRSSARQCPQGHGRLTVMAGGASLGCFNRIGEDEAQRLHGDGLAIAKLEGSKKFVCAYVEPISV